MEQQRLEPVGTGAGVPEADPSLGIDHPVPGHPALGLEGVQRVAHLTSVAGEAGQGGYLTVGGHSAARNASDDGVDPGIG